MENDLKGTFILVQEIFEIHDFFFILCISMKFLKTQYINGFQIFAAPEKIAFDLIFHEPLIHLYWKC